MINNYHGKLQACHFNSLFLIDSSTFFGIYYCTVKHLAIPSAGDVRPASNWYFRLDHYFQGTVTFGCSIPFGITRKVRKINVTFGGRYFRNTTALKYEYTITSIILLQ